MNFRHEIISEHIIRIVDKLNVAMYLITGDEKAALIDTGYGYKGLRNYVENLTSKPLLVLLSHGHVDHAFGIYEFADLDIYMHYDDLETYAMHSDLDYRDRFLSSYGTHLSDEFQPEREMTFKEMVNDQIFDLGNYHIQAIHIPGHTKGMMMFLLREERVMLYGDACGANTMIMEDCSANLSDYLKSLQYLKTLDAAYDTIYRNHGSFVSEKGLADNVIEAVNRVLNGTDDRVPLPDSMQNMFPKKAENHLICYSAVKADMDKGGIRYDGKEGNVHYRSDKAI